MSSNKWKKFFIDSGLPTTVADNYAVVFVENRIRFDMLNELNKEILCDMGIKKMGDVISILRHAKEVYSNTHKEKLFASDTGAEDGDDLNNRKKDFIKADSTISSDNVAGGGGGSVASANAITAVHATSRIIIDKPPSASNNRIVITKPLNEMKRNVTGLDSVVVASMKRKRIEPPEETPPAIPKTTTTASNVNVLTKTDMVRMKVPLSRPISNRTIIDEKTRASNFSKNIQKAIASNETKSGWNIKTIPSAATKGIVNSQNVNVPKLLSKRTPDSTTPAMMTNRTSSLSTTKKSIHDRLGLQLKQDNQKKPNIKDRLGTKKGLVFERIGSGNQTKSSVFNRLG